MIRRRRLRTFTLWTGATLCLLIVVAFLVSARWLIASQVPRPSGPAMYLMAGSVTLLADDVLPVPVLIEPHSFSLLSWNSWFAQRFVKTMAGPVRTATYSKIPLYAPFAAVAIPTLLVWRFVPRFPRGHCRRCG